MSNEQITREQAQTNLDAALSVQLAARNALNEAIAAVSSAKANVMEADAKVMLARAALQRLGGPLKPEPAGGAKTGQYDLCAAVTKVLQANPTPMTVDQIIAAVQADGVVLNGTKPRENLTAYIARWSKVPNATIVNRGRGLWGTIDNPPQMPSFLQPAEVTDEKVQVPEAPVEVPAFLAPTEPVQDSDDADESPVMLPEGFPGRQALTEAGYLAYDDIRGKSHDQLRRIKGVGAETARQILAALEA